MFDSLIFFKPKIVYKLILILNLFFMVKFGKEFKKNLVPHLHRSYINYKSLKHSIKEYLYELPNSEDKEEFINSISNEFISKLDIEIKKVVSSYTHQEKEIKTIMNSLLHNRQNYQNYSLIQIKREFNDITTTLDLTSYLSKFSFYNLLALQKILKKFDKKFNVEIKYHYIRTKIEEKSKSILYILKFRIIDEVIALIEDIKKELFIIIKKGNFPPKEISEYPSMSFHSNKFSEEKISDSCLEEKLTNEQILIIINQQESKIKKSLSFIENYYSKTQRLYERWEQYLSLQIKKKVNPNNDENDNKNLSVETIELVSIDNFKNIIIIFIETFYSYSSFAHFLPFYFFFSPENNRNTLFSLFLFFSIIGRLITMLIVSQTLKNRYYKTPLITFVILSFFGNCLFSYLAICSPNSLSSFLPYLFCFSRFLIGFGSNTYLNRNYFSFYIPKRKKEKYLKRMEFISYIGLCFGLLLWLTTLLIPPKLIRYINLFFPSLGIILIILIMLFFKEPYQKNFKIYKNNQNESIVGNSFVINYDSESSLLSNEKEDDLQNNQRNDSTEDFQDLNLIRQSISELAWREQKTSGYIKISFILFLLFEFITSFIYYDCLLTPLFMLSTYQKATPLILALVIFSIHFFILFVNLVFYFFLYNFESLLVFISLIIGFATNIGILLFIFFFASNSIVYCVLIVIFAVAISFTEKMSHSLSKKIIPADFKWNKMSISFSFNLIKLIGSSLGALISILLDCEPKVSFTSFFYIFLIGLINIVLVITLLTLFIIKHNQFKVKAISRLMGERALSKYQSSKLI